MNETFICLNKNGKKTYDFNKNLTLKRNDFDYKEDNSKFEQGTYKSTLSKSLLNNLEFSAGIEKKYNRMIFQVHPYISAQLRETAYKKEEFVFGAKMRFFVNLGK